MSDTRSDESSHHYRKLKSGYDLPTREPLSADEEREFARKIQAGNAVLDRITDLFRPMIETTLSSADISPRDALTLLEPALAGARRAAESFAIIGTSDGDFSVSAAKKIQRSVAEVINSKAHFRMACGGDGATWAASRFTRQVIESHSESASAFDPEFLAKLRDRSKAIESLVAAHTRLVRAILSSQRGRGLDEQEMMQRAYMVLRQAAESFDPARHPRFAPLASRAIQNEFQNARRENSGASASGCRLIAEFERERIRLADRPGPPPHDDEVFKSLEWSRTKKENYRLARAIAAVPAALVDEDISPRRRVGENPLAALIAREDSERFKVAWAGLTPLAQEILVARYQAVRKETRAQLVARLGHSLHELRRIEDEAFERLQTYTEAAGKMPPLK